MIEKIKAYWPVTKAILDLLFYSLMTFFVLRSMFLNEWAEGTFWAVSYCMWKLTDIKEVLNDRL